VEAVLVEEMKRARLSFISTSGYPADDGVDLGG
jgi:hypothetical protein